MVPGLDGARLVLTVFDPVPVHVVNHTVIADDPNFVVELLFLFLRSFVVSLLLPRFWPPFARLTRLDRNGRCFLQRFSPIYI